MTYRLNQRGKVISTQIRPGLQVIFYNSLFTNSLTLFRHLFCKMAMIYTTYILFFLSFNILQGNSEETMSPAGPLNQSPGSARPKPDVVLEMLIMFVLFTNAAQSRFLFFFKFGSCLSPESIYTDSHSDINSKQRAFWSCHIKASCLLENVPQGHGLWHQYSSADACVSPFRLLVYSGEKVQRKSLSDS